MGPSSGERARRASGHGGSGNGKGSRRRRSTIRRARRADGCLADIASLRVSPSYRLPSRRRLTLIVLVPLTFVSPRFACAEGRVVCTCRTPLALAWSSDAVPGQQRMSLLTLPLSLRMSKSIRLSLRCTPLVPLVPLISCQCKWALAPPARSATGRSGKVEARDRPRSFHFPILFLLRRTSPRWRFQPSTR